MIIKNNKTLKAVDYKGLTVKELHEYLGHLLKEKPDMTDKLVSLCLPEVDTMRTVIVKAVNEDDDSILWLEMHHLWNDRRF
jgi:hypothetical protein